MSRRGWALFLAMCLIWGIPYLLIRIAVRDLDPVDLVFARTAPAAVLLLPIAYRRKALGPVLPHWRWVLVFIVVEMAVPWLMLSSAEEKLTSSTSGLMIATVPLLAAIVYRAFPHAEVLGRRRLFGLCVGFAGVAVLVGITFNRGDTVALLEIAVVALGYTLGPLIINQRLGTLPGIGVVALAVSGTALIYLPLAVTHRPQHLSLEVLFSALGLAVICTALAFVLFFELIAEVGPARSTVITYVNPAIAVLLGVGLLNEKLTDGILIGFPLILAGCLLATGRSEELAAESPHG